MGERVDVNLGCGDHHPPGWVNLDADGGCGPDYVADAGDLPFPSKSVSRLFAAHVLEHIGFSRLGGVLAEFGRVLEPDGELCIVGPDIERAVILGETSQLLRWIVAWPDSLNPGSAFTRPPPAGHAWTASGPVLEFALASAGFGWTAYAGRLRELARLGWPLENFADYQNGYVCRKEP